MLANFFSGSLSERFIPVRPWGEHGLCAALVYSGHLRRSPSLSAAIEEISMSTAANAAPAYAKPITGLIPYLSLSSATGASEFYQKAFGAQEAARHPVDDKGRTMHIHLYINGSSLMLSAGKAGRFQPDAAGQGHRLVVESRHRRRRHAGDAGPADVLGRSLRTAARSVRSDVVAERDGAVKNPFFIFGWRLGTGTLR
jgi:hypothetical protein